jgi:hypothetical protein
MLALAIEFSRCPRARTLKAEQRVSPPALADEDGQCIDLESSGKRTAHIGDPRSAKRLLRKEVIQPQLPLRLPCYDFTPIASPTFDGSLLTVRPPASGVAHFRGVTGGVYKPRERIHRSIADLRLLATPTSRGRVADLDPN